MKTDAVVFHPCLVEDSIVLECLGGPCCGQKVRYKSDPIADGMIIWEPDHLACGWYEPFMVFRVSRDSGICLRWVP